MENTSLQIQKISKAFFGNTVLHEVSFDLKKGEVLSLLGENGAGKSTLVKIISGVHVHGTYSGVIHDDQGKELSFSSPAEANKAGIVMIYQEISVEYDLSVAENIMLGLWDTNAFGILDWKRLKKTAQEVLETLRSDIDPNMILRELGASKQQIVCIARALVRKPKILILDEPTASLTENEMLILFDTIRILKKQGISCIYISHRLPEIFLISDRLAILRDGSLISQYDRKDFDEKKIIHDMIGKDLAKQKKKPPVKEKESEEVLRVENLSLNNPNNAHLTIIDDISFSINKGEVLGLAGILGSGRSEILRAIYGEYPLVNGKIFMRDKELSIHSAQDAIAQGIGFLTEERKRDGYVHTMNIRHNTSLSILERLCRFKQLISFPQEQKIVDEYLTKMHYRGPDYGSSIMHLSGGNQQKVIFSKSLMTDSRCLLLDEPTRGIDVGAKEEIYHIIEQLVEEGCSILLVSSEFPELMRLSSRILILHEGRVAKELRPPEFDEENIMKLVSFGV